MKKILTIIIFNLFFISHSLAEWGKGDLQITKQTADHFIKFIRGKGAKYPSDFYVTTDGANSYYFYCSHGPTSCWPGDMNEDIKACERFTGKDCKKFAFKRTIKWKNGINPGKGKKSKIKSKWSDQEIYDKLNELGFYKN